MLIYIFPLFFRIVSQTILFLEFSNHTPMNYAFYKNTQSKNVLLQKRINFIVFFFLYVRVCLELLDLKIFLLSRLHYTWRTAFFNWAYLIRYPEPNICSSWVTNFMVILFENIWKCEKDLWMQLVISSILLVGLTSRCPTNALH